MIPRAEHLVVSTERSHEEHLKTLGCSQVGLFFDGKKYYTYSAAPPEQAPQISANIVRIINLFGHSPETTILVNPYPGASSHVRIIGSDDYLYTLDFKKCHADGYAELQPQDDTMVLTVEGVFVFKPYLLMMKPSDCHVLLIDAKTSLGHCSGIVHAGRNAIMTGAAVSWIKPLLSICACPDDILVQITPGLSPRYHVIGTEYVHPYNGHTFDDHRETFGRYATLENASLHLDCEGYVSNQMRKEGIERIAITNSDTYEMQAQGRGSSKRFTSEHNLPYRTTNVCAIAPQQTTFMR